MQLWLNEVFSNYELENKTKSIYRLCNTNINEFVKKFEEIFGVSYEIAFGKEDPQKCFFELLKKYYPNEYYIKKTFAKKYLKNTNLIYEYPVNDCRADIVDINNRLSCYEIKTKFDSLKRLSKQIDDYSKLFEYVFIICSEDKYLKVKEIVPSYCGIITYTNNKNSSFNKRRNAKISPNVNISNILNHFYKKELMNYFRTYDKYDILNKFSKKNIINLYKTALYKRYYD